MIPDYQTNTVYFSEELLSEKYAKRKANALKIFQILNDFGVRYKFLKNTKDIWARDFMPI
ncbi:MAG: hypothetical protein JXL97_07135 [Bacteroidales bacterium]|nr:hypothetical protein [Bacteroidales bacterium]